MSLTNTIRTSESKFLIYNHIYNKIKYLSKRQERLKN